MDKSTKRLDMEKVQKVMLPVIILLIVVSFIFIGFELGKMWSARNVVTQAVASIDPFLYCDIHSDFNVSRDDIDNMENYAVELYIIMSTRSIRSYEESVEPEPDITVKLDVRSVE